MKTGRCGVKLGAWVIAACFGGLTPLAPALAQTPPGAEVRANNRIENIVAADQGGNVMLKLSLIHI